jgi:dihydrodipicolinate synthase/N-acetylneuraminate lyase
VGRSRRLLEVMVPVLTLRQADGSLDLDLTHRYAQRAKLTLARCFLISGTVGRGEQSSPNERSQLLSIWLQVVGTERLVSCCWQPGDIQVAINHGIQPMIVIRDQGNLQQLLATLSTIPRESLVYSHPRYSSTTFDISAAAAARRAGVLPRGAKVSKVSVDTVASLRSVTGVAFDLWHGSSRNVAMSLGHGASGVVSAPLSTLPAELGVFDLLNLQKVIDRNQRLLDAFSRRKDALEFLASSMSRTLSMPAGRKG